MGFTSETFACALLVVQTLAMLLLEALDIFVLRHGAEFVLRSGLRSVFEIVVAGSSRTFSLDIILTLGVSQRGRYAAVFVSLRA